jgi:hypothetical protein
VLDPVSIPLVLTGSAGVGFLYLVGLSSMHIPRLVTWRGVGEILLLLDLRGFSW